MYYAALILGLVSSLHCVGMCAPLTLALPFDKNKVFFQTLSYHLGRSLMYATLGLLFGFLGRGLAVSGFQQILSVLFGIVFLILGVLSFFKKYTYHIAFFPKLTAFVRQSYGRVMRWRGAFFWLGILNGLLPCGVVYWAIAGSLLTFDAIGGAIYMFLFGIGTMPLLLAVIWFKTAINRSFVQGLYRLIPVYQFGLGAFLIWRAFIIDPSVFYLLTPAPLCH